MRTIWLERRANLLQPGCAQSLPPWAPRRMVAVVASGDGLGIRKGRERERERGRKSGPQDRDTKTIIDAAWMQEWETSDQSDTDLRITCSTVCITRVHSMSHMIGTGFLVAAHALAGLLALVTMQAGDCLNLCWLPTSSFERMVLEAHSEASAWSTCLLVGQNLARSEISTMQTLKNLLHQVVFENFLTCVYLVLLPSYCICAMQSVSFETQL